jgi:phosphoribosyl 1,2-cyclic phosphodiesterase
VKVRFWGVRGSIPTPGHDSADVGGNTSCVQVLTGHAEPLILDAGTGIRLLGNALMADAAASQGLAGHVLLSHTHWDHIQGFPFFSPAFSPKNEFYVYGAGKAEERLEDVLKGQMNYQYFPVALDQMGANIHFVELQEETFTIFGDVEISTRAFHHPGGVYGFRIVHQGQILVYATDMEYTEQNLDPKLIEFARNADLLIYDAQYTPEELKVKTGWGHSTHTTAAYLAQQAGVKQLALYHHDPSHTDAQLYQMEAEAQAIFAASTLAVEGLTLDLDRP